MTENKNILIASALCFLILFISNTFFDNFSHKNEEVSRRGQEISSLYFMTEDEALHDGEHVILSNENVVASVMRKGSNPAIDFLKLLSYRRTISINPELLKDKDCGCPAMREKSKKDNENYEKHNNMVRIFMPNKTEKPYFASFGWVSHLLEPLIPENAEWQWKDAKSDSIVLFYETSDGVYFEHKISLDDENMFKIDSKVINKSAAEITIRQSNRIYKEFKESPDSNFLLHEGFVGVFNQKLVEKGYGKLESISEEGDPIKRSVVVHGKGWGGLTDKYWLSAFSLDAAADIVISDKSVINKASDLTYIEFRGSPITVRIGEEINQTSYLFCGPKNIDLLDKYKQKYQFDKFDLAIDFGMLYFVTRPLLHFLRWIHSMIGNFGVAIIILTLLLKLLSFPLSRRSHSSMSKMKNLQPKLTKLKQMYGDDKKRLNQAIAELYQKEGINPVSGCLPMLLQIPIFFSLYKVLFVCIEMRHAPFFGWIKDLSAPDPTSLFNLFGLISWNPPSFLHIGIWPIIMGGTMFLQQKMTPTPVDANQAKIMMFMPVLFTAMLAQFPVGLVIYWSFSNAFSILQTFILMRKK